VFFPEVDIASIPYIGSSVSSTLVTAVSYWNAFMVTLPFMADVWHVFLYAILPFEILMIFLKFFLGNRVPSAD